MKRSLDAPGAPGSAEAGFRKSRRNWKTVTDRAREAYRLLRDACRQSQAFRAPIARGQGIFAAILAGMGSDVKISR
jgi:hypothetical protein